MVLFIPNNGLTIAQVVKIATKGQRHSEPPRSTRPHFLRSLYHVKPYIRYGTYYWYWT